MSLAAFFDEVLGRLISAFLRDTKSSEDILEGFNAPLGTFSARIRAAHALGLINDAEFADCERLRKIRNAFAHSWLEVSLERDDIKSHIMSLSEPMRLASYDPMSLSSRLLNSLAGTLIALELLAVNVERVKTQKSVFFFN